MHNHLYEDKFNLREMVPGLALKKEAKGNSEIGY